MTEKSMAELITEREYIAFNSAVTDNVHKRF